MQGKGKTIALVGLLIVLVGFAAWLWWPEPSAPLGPNPIANPEPEPEPVKPTRPGQPDAPTPPPPPAPVSG